MADAPQQNRSLVEFLISFFFVAIVVSHILATLLGWIESAPLEGSLLANIFYNYILPLLKFFSLLISFLAAGGIVYVLKKMGEVVERERELYGLRHTSTSSDSPVAVKNEKWERIVELINSPDSSNWRLAIIEADIILDDFLRRAGYHGDSIGDMLKSVERSDFTTLDSAWEAHKIRNNVVHSGSDYALNERDAKRAVALYEDVFKEFEII